MNKNKAHLLSVPVSAYDQISHTPKDVHLAVVKSEPADDHFSDLEAADYIADLLESLQGVAVKAKLDMLSDLIHVAKEEARFHSR